MRLSRLPASIETIERFLAPIAKADGFPPLSEHKAMRIGGGADATVAAWGDGERVVAVSVAALHEGDTPHWALEVATAVDARSPILERAAIAAAASTVPPDLPCSLWVARAAQLSAAASLGYREQRRLLHLEGRFPADPERTDIRLSTVADVDDAALIALHNRAFAGHREVSGMTLQRLRALRALPWYDPAGVIVAWVDEGFAGFCWTKLHGDGAGEVYLLAVDPSARRRGLGELLASAGFAHLRERGALRATLWVEAANQQAIALYQSLGLRQTRFNVEMIR
jgi:mycothiol synthase